MKHCTHCGAERSLTDFSPDRRASDGRNSWCRACLRAAVADWAERNKDHVREHAAAYYRGTIEVRRAQGRAYYEANREKVLARTSANYRARPRDLERERKKWRRWYARNAPARAAYVRARRLLRGHFDPLGRDYISILALDPCSYCGGPADAVDHIEASSRGGANVWENLTAACQSCNSRKKDRPLLPYLLSRNGG